MTLNDYQHQAFRTSGPGRSRALWRERRRRRTRQTTPLPRNGTRRHGVTALIPAYNEAHSIVSTIETLLKQTVPLAQILVIDDCSTDDTATLACAAGAPVLKLSHNTGKARALNQALAEVDTAYVMTVDADTRLAPDALAHLLAAMDDMRVGVACAKVLPWQLTTLWERGRLVEYTLGQFIHKSAQHRLRSVLVASGCCALYRTPVLQSVGGFRPGTITEDLDTTWLLFEEGFQTAFVAEARCFTMEPTTLQMYTRQLDRWYRGMWQCLACHTWRRTWRLKLLVYWYIVDALLAPVALVATLIGTTQSPLYWCGLAFLLELGMVGLVAVGAEPRRWREILSGLPAYLLLRHINLYAYLLAFWRERMQNQHLAIWHKGH